MKRTIAVVLLFALLLSGCASTAEVLVILDRPFVYMLIDCESNLPFFMGTCMEIGG